MLSQQFETILARTGPFGVAQGLERYIRTLSGEQARFVIVAAGSLMNESYRAEFLPLLTEPDDERLKNAFTQVLKSNLRALPLFGPAFCEGVISHIPGDRPEGPSEQGRRFNALRPILIGLAAIALFVAGAAVQRFMSSAGATAQTRVVIVTPKPVPVQTPHRHREPARVRSTPQPVYAQAAEAPAPAPAPPAPVPRTAPPGGGVKTVVALPSTPAPSPEPAAIDVSDMPQSYSDATPLPKDETAPPAQVPTQQEVATPTPRPGSWLQRTFTHLDPFKVRPQSKPSPYGRMPS